MIDNILELLLAWDKFDTATPEEIIEFRRSVDPSQDAFYIKYPEMIAQDIKSGNELDAIIKVNGFTRSEWSQLSESNRIGLVIDRMDQSTN